MVFTQKYFVLKFHFVVTNLFHNKMLRNSKERQEDLWNLNQAARLDVCRCVNIYTQARHIECLHVLIQQQRDFLCSSV